MFVIRERLYAHPVHLIAGHIICLYSNDRASLISK